MPKFNKEEIIKYYEILGVSNLDNLIVRDQINLNYIGDLYIKNNFSKKLSYTAEELSNVYSLLIQMIRDVFWYETKQRRENALNSSFEVINDLTQLKIETGNPETDIERRNNLYTTVIKGLCEVGDIISFRLYQNNSSFDSICKKMKNWDENEPEDLQKLYYIMALSKSDKNENNIEIFDSLNKVSLQKLKKVVYQDTSLDKSNEKEYGKAKILTLKRK